MTAWCYAGLIVLAISHVAAQELKIDRPKAVEVKTVKGLPKGWEKLDNGLLRATFPVSGRFEKSHPELQSPLHYLESLGVPFKDGASATYDPKTSAVTVTNTRSALEMAAVVFLEFTAQSPNQGTVRTEIYQVTSLQALQLAESSQHAVDHRPEREALRDSNAKLIATHAVTTTLGQRVTLEDTYGVRYAFKYDQAGKLIESDSARVGTILDCEFAGWGSQSTINLAFEHHTADPEMVVMPGKLIAPRFHAKTIYANLNIPDGGYKLIGIWKPTGRPEYLEGDVRQVVFITINYHFE